MPANGLLPSPRLLLASLLGAVLGAATVQADSPFSFTSSTQTLYLAQIDDDDLDELDDDIDDELEDLEDELDDLDDDIEDELDDELEDELDDELEDELDDLAEDAAEDALDDDAEDLAEELAEEAAEDELEDSLDDDAEDLAEELAEEAAEDRLDEDDWEDELDDIDDDLEDELDDDDLDDRFDEDDELADALEERLLDALEEDLDSLIELNTGDLIVRNEMLVLADDALLEQLSRHPALDLRERQPLSALGTSLGSFEVKSDVPLEPLRTELRERYPGLSVDFNHGYEYHQGPKTAPDAPLTLSALYRPGAPSRSGTAIGMLDGPVNTRHPAFARARLQQKAFAARPSVRDMEHGTAVASLLVGRTQDWEGLAPDAELYIASVFSEQAEYGSIATTQTLITALDWLVSRPVKVINISLSGPANQTLETVLEQIRSRGILPVAAVGNAGPLADPQYPAAYPTVVAVTAVDRALNLYPYAVRGDHLDFAAYGVNLTAASGDQGFTQVSGTSFAAPVVTALLSRQLAGTGSPGQALQTLSEDTVDLGEPGKDPLFGLGLPGKSQLAAPASP